MAQARGKGPLLFLFFFYLIPFFYLSNSFFFFFFFFFFFAIAAERSTPSGWRSPTISGRSITRAAAAEVWRSNAQAFLHLPLPIAARQSHLPQSPRGRCALDSLSSKQQDAWIVRSNAGYRFSFRLSDANRDSAAHWRRHQDGICRASRHDAESVARRPWHLGHRRRFVGWHRRGGVDHHDQGRADARHQCHRHRARLRLWPLGGDRRQGHRRWPPQACGPCHQGRARMG